MKENTHKKALFTKYLIGAISLLVTTILVSRSGAQSQQIPSVGEIADQEITAQIDFSYVDKQATDALKEEEARKVLPIYCLDQSVKENATKRIDELFSAITNKKIDTWLDNDITVKTLMQTSNPEQVKANILKLCTELLDKGIITSFDRIKMISSGKDTVLLRNLQTQDITEMGIDKFIVEDKLEPILEDRLKAMYPFNRPFRQAMEDVVLRLMKPNIVYDSNEVERRKEVARQSTSPIYREIKKGQIILRRGDPVTEIHRQMLEAHREELNRVLKGFNRWWNILGSGLLVFIFFFILVQYLDYHHPQIFSSNKRLLLLSIIIISILGITRLSSYIPVNPEKPFFQYFIMVPASAVLIAVLMDKELAIISSMLTSVLATVIVKGNLPYTVVVLFGSIVGVQTTKRLLHRWEFIRAGVFIGLAHILAIIMVILLKFYSLELYSWKTIAYQLAGGGTSGIACAIFVSICLPILEHSFDITTDIRLLELSDLDHPLLKKMITEAPGTYHHSIVVSNMAEDAASSIGANPLLAKVGGYFHDIGKTTKPEYFVENVWFAEESRHEKLQPTMSNLVITAHVKDGVQLAQRYKLPKIIIDIITQHHGTSLVYYFYKQAEKIYEKEGSEIMETDFRYPGPKPQTKEAGIILLADATEAASHTLVKPTPGKIESLVKEILDEKIKDGQLDECGLTMKDINMIRDRFTNILTGILHKRIEYPKEDEDKHK